KVYEKDGIKGKRETSTMPGSAGSSWYFLRYIDPHNDKEFANYELLKHWMPVDLYVGGPEHAVGHLMYSRIWNNYLYDKGLSPVKEPFKKLVHQGMILGENGIKMGKRYPEFVVNPSDIVKQYGADTLRLYEMFMGPLEASKPWNAKGVEGAKKWLERVYRLFIESGKVVDTNDHSLDRIYHQTVKKVTNDFESLGFNTAISQMMVFVNECYKVESVYKEYAQGIVKMLSCICPHIGEEMWQLLGHNESIAYEPWPTYDESKLVSETFTCVVQVNGKVRGKFEVAVDIDQEALKQQALEIESVKKQVEGKTIRKIIVVKGKIVNIVAN
ncbi:MAG: class I tRNA ligase family protein, partial [Floccifex sp.]